MNKIIIFFTKKLSLLILNMDRHSYLKHEIFIAKFNFNFKTNILFTKLIYEWKAH